MAAIGALRRDLVTLREAARAYRRITQRQTFVHTLRPGRDQRLLWTALIDRYQLRPEQVGNCLSGRAPGKEYLRNLETWVARPEDPSLDLAADPLPVEWLTSSYEWVALVGATGVGKSTAGRSLAKEMGREFVDLDDIAEIHLNQSLATAFDQLGSRRTLAIYEQAVAEWVSTQDTASPLVVSFGGGSILQPAIRDLVARCQDRIWLTAPPWTIVDRLARDLGHAAHAFGRREFRELIRLVQIARAPLYASVSSRWVSGDDSLANVVRAMSPVMAAS
jgi:shikimate kinase